MILKKQILGGAIAVLTAVMLSWMPLRVSAAGSETFVAYKISAVRVDGDPPKEWSLYHEARDKMNRFVLLEWGKRFIRLEVKFREAKEIKPESITKEKNSVVWTGDDSTMTLLPSGEWTLRDGRLVQRLHLVLTAESHEIDIDLPSDGK
jgi:hypothetical protein